MASKTFGDVKAESFAEGNLPGTKNDVIVDVKSLCKYTIEELALQNYQWLMLHIVLAIIVVYRPAQPFNEDIMLIYNYKQIHFYYIALVVIQVNLFFLVQSSICYLVGSFVKSSFVMDTFGRGIGSTFFLYSKGSF